LGKGGYPVTTKQLAELLGKQADYRVNGLTIPVRITDSKYVFNTTKVRIQPLSGAGEIWVNLSSVTVFDNADTFQAKGENNAKSI